MSMPFYVSPEQSTKDKADFARKGISRGRSVVVASYDQGICFVAENPSRGLRKISELYDRIGFAAVGKYNEFESLRVAGIRLADIRGYTYDRSDVTGRALANAYAQTLGAIFTEAIKPYEVELVVAEVGDSADQDQIFRLTFDGSVTDEHGYVAMGGNAEQISRTLAENWHGSMSLPDTLRVAIKALESGASDAPARPEPHALESNALEVALLERARPRRSFRRLDSSELDRIIESK